MNKIHLTVFLLICLIAGAVYSLYWNPDVREIGESCSYISATMTLLRSGRISFLKQDIRDVEEVFGKLRVHNYARYKPSDRTWLHRLATKEAQSPDFVGRSFYWGTYSFLCIPAYLFCRTFHIFESNMFNAFKWTNILMLLVPLLAVIFLLKGSVRLKYLMLAAFAFPAAAQYINWASAECCIYMLVTLSLVFLHNREYCRSSLCVCFAVTLNYTAFPLSLVILFCFLRDHWQEFSFRPFRVPKELIGKFLLLGCCYLPLLYAVAWTSLQYSGVVLGPIVGPGYWNRFYSYLFDLNLGIWIYHPLLFTAFLLSIIMIIWKREWVLGTLWLAFFGMVLGYSLNFHIQSGMEGISRYGVWSVPVAIYVVVCLLDRYVSLRIAVPVMVVSALFCGLSLVFPFYGGECSLTGPAQFVLDHCPSCYNPYYPIFAFRVKHRDGYRLPRPVVYYYGKCAKILVTKEQLTHFWDRMKDYDFNDAARRTIEEQREKLLKRDRKYYYLDLDASCRVVPKNWKKQIYTVNRLYTAGAAVRKGNSFVLSRESIQFGPYIWLPSGSYHVRITGENLDKLLFYCTSKKGERQHHLRDQKCTGTVMEYDVYFRKTVYDVEFVTRNLQAEPGKISTITLTCL